VKKDPNWNAFKYTRLWNETDPCLTFSVMDFVLTANDDHLIQEEIGRIVADSWMQAESLLERGIQAGRYPASSQLMQYCALIQE